ncbi:MAG: hypothetical protein SVG88_09015 [Halobacteriales archaeon]|nr:hypothetical protein [Halobacteriales archaeon]
MSRDRCKVDDTIDTYDLHRVGVEGETLNEQLVARWTGTEGYQAVGYRTLATWFNKQLLRRVYDRHGRATTGNRIESDYEAIQGDDELIREEVIGDLKADGIDADAVTDAMVSPRTMHRHLKQCLDAEKQPQTAQTDWERESIDRAREQLEEKVAKAASALDSKGEFNGADDATIEIQIYLACPECATRVPFDVGRQQGYVCEEHFAPPEEATIAADGPGVPPNRATDTDDKFIEAVEEFAA